MNWKLSFVEGKPLYFTLCRGQTPLFYLSSEAAYARKLGMTSPLSFEVFRWFTETRPAEVVANIAICLIHQANYLLDQQLKALEKSFLKDGGLRERMTRARIQVRDQQRNGRGEQTEGSGIEKGKQ